MKESIRKLQPDEMQPITGRREHEFVHFIKNFRYRIENIMNLNHRTEQLEAYIIKHGHISLINSNSEK